MTELTTAKVRLRYVTSEDLPTFFEHQKDPDATHMAAFTSREPSDREVFDAHWARVLSDPTITMKTIVVEGLVAGNIVSFPHFGKPSVGIGLAKNFGAAGSPPRRFLLSSVRSG